jgi:hypothetical protein
MLFRLAMIVRIFILVHLNISGDIFQGFHYFGVKGKISQGCHYFKVKRRNISGQS